MPVGDSITRGSLRPFGTNADVPGGYRRLLGELLAGGSFAYDFVGDKSDNAAPGMDPEHNGNDGLRTDQMLNLVPNFLNKNPDVILLKAGTNDILQQKPVPDALRDLENLVLEVLMPRPDRRLHLATVIPIQSNWGGISQAVHSANAESYNAGVRQIAGRLATAGLRIQLVDLNQSVVLTHSDPSLNFFQPGDGIHPGAAGYDQLGTLWYNAITAGGTLNTPPVTGTPVKRTNPTATIHSSSSIRFTWGDPAADETSVEVWCREMSAGLWQKVALLPANSTSHTITGLLPLQNSYRIAVNAVNANGMSGWSTPVTVTPESAWINLAGGKPATASSFYNNSATFAPSRGNDNSIHSLWASGGSGLHWWQVDLQGAFRIDRIDLVTRQDSDVSAQRRNFRILASNDPSFAAFTVIATQGSTPLAHKSTLTVPVTDVTEFRYVRVQKTVNETFSIAELRVVAPSFTDPPPEEPPPAGPSVRIMPMGDSITRGSRSPGDGTTDIPGGYRRRLGELLTSAGHSFDFVGDKSDNAAPGMDPHHNGNNSWRTDQMLAMLDTWLTKDPDVVLLKAGTNDVLQEIDLETAAKNLENTIIEILMPRHSRRVFLATVLPIVQDRNGISQAVLNAGAEAFNVKVREIAARLSAGGLNATLVDLNQQVVLIDPDPAKNFFQGTDGIHPGQAGYDQLGELWHAAITAAGGPVFPASEGVPLKRTGLGAEMVSPSRVNLTWTDPATDETANEIWCRHLPAGVWRKIATLPADATSYPVTGLDVTTASYRFAINAVNANGSSGWGNLVTTSPPGNSDSLALLSPAIASSEFSINNTATKANDGSITTLWASTGAGPHWWQLDLKGAHTISRIELVTRQDSFNIEVQRRNFRILASNDPTFATHVLLGEQGATPVSYKGTFTLAVSNPTAYRYLRVEKTDTDSFSIAEFRVTGSLWVVPPAAPAALSVSPLGPLAARLEWMIASNNESGFRIERRDGVGGPFATVATQAALVSEHIDGDLVGGTTYTYRVFAVNEAGDSPPSPEVSFSTGVASPYDNWAAAYPEFLALDEPQRLPGADPNQDGIPNLLSYAFGLDPLTTAGPGMLPAILPDADPASGSFLFRFVRNPAATDLIYQAESSGLGPAEDWSVVPLDHAEISAAPGRPDLEQVVVPVRRGEFGDKRLFRVRVTRVAGP